MRLRRIFAAAALLAAVLGVSAPASASKCGQYPTFIEPILCRKLP
jgi:hypothetical protein